MELGRSGRTLMMMRPAAAQREARWAIRPTRSSRLGGASAISFKRYSALGRSMELGSGRTLVAAAAAPGARWI